jgi:DNA-binding transcriptional LysR family regulator
MQPADWSDYQAFLAIARHGQLARAAQASGVNATTMGRRLRRLEARLGTTLFEQTREGQQLTDAGEALLVAVEGMALAAGAIEPAAGKDVLGRVRISVSEGLGSWIIARHLGAFARAHPGLSIDLVASNGFLNPPGARRIWRSCSRAPRPDHWSRASCPITRCNSTPGKSISHQAADPRRR